MLAEPGDDPARVEVRAAARTATRCAAVVLVGLNPIVLVWGLGGDHNDFLMIFFIMLGFYLLLLAQARASAERRTRAGSDPDDRQPVGAGAWLAGAAVGAGRRRRRGVRDRDRDQGLGRGPDPGGAREPAARAARARAGGAGDVLAGAVVAAASLLAFGLHIPDLSTQSSLVTSESVPNLIGLALGAGRRERRPARRAERRCLRSGDRVRWLAWRRQRRDHGVGWASVALLVTLSWVLPWYVLWVLPLAALSRSRRLRTVTLVLGVYLIIAWAPASGLLWNALHFYPEKTPLGRLHQRYVKELLN